MKRADSIESLASIVSSNIRGARTVAGALQLDIEYIAPANRAREGLITVKVARATGLKATQPFVKLFVTLDEPSNKSPRQATVPKSGTEPIFNQHFTFKLPPRQAMDDRSQLHLLLWDHARTTAAECMGGMTFPFDDIEQAGKMSGWFRVLPYSEGRTRFEAMRDSSDTGPRRGQGDDTDADGMQAEIEDLRQQLDDAHAEIETLRSNNADLQQRANSSRGNQSMTEENQALRVQLQEIFQEKEQLDTHVKELEEHSASITEMLKQSRAEAEQLEHERDQLQQRLEDKNDEIQTLRSFVDRLQRELMNVDMKGLARASLVGAPQTTKGTPRRR